MEDKDKKGLDKSRIERYIEKLEHLRNVREFFDNFKRVKQKVRLKLHLQHSQLSSSQLHLKLGSFHLLCAVFSEKIK